MLVRKTVTVLFCDVTESTQLGERLDPESLRRVMSRYFDEMSAVLERHGGTVEKFIGDAVMAVFGVPTVHEDDALRAVNSATEMRERLAALNEELERAYGVTLQMRIGINTGEVVAGDPSRGHTLVTGDAVNVAKRLEEAAPPGLILIGKATYPLVKDAVTAGPLQAFRAKGKSEEVPSRRLDEVAKGAAGIARRLDAPLVDRETELGRLREELARVESERICRLVTVLGPAGIGKSRLARELLASAADRATTLTGRCLPYGEGITFWPLIEIVRLAGGEGSVRGALTGTEEGALAAERVLAAVGAGDASATTEEMFWGIRRYLEALARDRPLIVCLEDVHWAEPTLLDLLDYLAGWVREAPILLLCIARPDLLERRPVWSAPRRNATIVSVDPLSEADSTELLAAQPVGDVVSGAMRSRITEAAEGNPLFLEQLTAMAAESENGDVAVPPSIQAVIAERVDRLAPDERAVLECAAVVGKQFVRSEVVDLTPATRQATVGPALRALARKGLVRPDLSAHERDDGFRFGHVLIRDVTYEAMPKELRAELHEQYPDWLERNAPERASELEEIVAYHLEQAHRYRAELGRVDERTHQLALRASGLLRAAGRRAAAREDMPAAVTLLERALALGDPEDPGRPQLLTELGSALMPAGELERAGSLFEEAVDAANRLGDRRAELRATIMRQVQRSFAAPDRAAEENRRVAEAAIPELERLDDAPGLARGWWLLSEAHVIASRWAERAAALENALDHARRTPNGGAQTGLLVALLAQALLYGPTPVPEAVARCRDLVRDARGRPSLEAALGTTLAALHAMEGRIDEARRLYADSIAVYDELGLRFRRAVRSHLGAQIEVLGGDLRAAERELRAGYETLEAMGERGVRSTLAGFLADVLSARAVDDEAEHFARIADETAGQADLVPQVLWRRARARVLSRRGDHDAAEALALEAADLAGATDFLDLRGDTQLALAEVLAHAGSAERASDARREALSLHRSKGNVVAADRVAALLREPPVRVLSEDDGP